jgi:hypothetical protein
MFAKVQEFITCVPSTADRAGPAGAATMASAVVTCLVDSLRSDGTLPPMVSAHASDQGTPDASGWRWDPCFWGDNAVVQETLSLLMAGIADPVVWALGEYDSGELALLQERGSLPAGVPTGPHRGRVWHVPIILRFDKPSDLLLPFQQGHGHFPGVRLAVFAREAQPDELYEEWLGHALQGAHRALERALVSDTIAPRRAMAWLAPYGDENREHAIVAKAGYSAESLCTLLSSRLRLPLLTTQCELAEFEDWEADHHLPQDLMSQVDDT